MSGERCLFCNAPATRLCDAPIAMVEAGWHKPKGRPPYRITTMEAMLSHSYTCDVPFCGKHGKVIGFICGKDPDTIDHCAGCVAAGRDGGRGLLSPGAIDALRKQWHADYRRMRLGGVPA